MLTRLIYHSENHVGPFDQNMIAGLNAIMDVAVRRNKNADVTGALIFDACWFLQILEGEREAVSMTFRRIVTDERHDNVTLMEVKAIPERMFGNWWMGLANIQGVSASLFEKFGLGSRFNPPKLTGDQAMILALDLAQHGLDRQIVAPAA